jgi:hypothetical protein
LNNKKEWVWGEGAAASAFEARVPTAASLQFKEHDFPESPQSNRTHLRRHSSLCGVEQQPESRTQFPPRAQTYGLDKDLRRSLGFS